MEKKKVMDKNLFRLLEGRMVLDNFVVAMDAIDVSNSFAEIIGSILNCEGKTITTGMGKAGIAMRNFSAILCSLGIPSCYLHPGEASHGDLGLISEKDILFVASTSGKTREVLETIDLARKTRVKEIIGITSHADSPIRKKADKILNMGEILEAGHLRMAPTTSILTIIALTNALALVAAKEKCLTMEEYSRYHHSGYLGEKAKKQAKRKK